MSFKTLFSILPFGFLILAIFTVVIPAKLRVRVQAIVVGLLTLAAAKFVVFAALGGDAFSPDLPEKFIWSYNFFYSTFIILTLLSTLTCLLKLIFHHSPLITHHSSLIILLLSAALAAYGIYHGLAYPQINKITLAYPNLPAELEGLTIVHLSDLHISPAARAHRTRDIVEKVNALTPDLICLTGDIVDGAPAQLRRDVEPLKNLKSKYGVFACTGNHEFYWHFSDWEPLYQKWNFTFLRGAAVRPLPKLIITGRDDVASNYSRYGLAPEKYLRFPKVEKASDEFLIHLEHRPKFAPRFAREHAVDLQLSGHTHGGVMPLLDLIVARFNGGFTRGLYPLSSDVQSSAKDPERLSGSEQPCERTRRSELLVSPGCGQWAGFPFRIFNPTEITLITLTK